MIFWCSPQPGTFLAKVLPKVRQGTSRNDFAKIQHLGFFKFFKRLANGFLPNFLQSGEFVFYQEISENFAEIYQKSMWQISVENISRNLNDRFERVGMILVEAANNFALLILPINTTVLRTFWGYIQKAGKICFLWIPPEMTTVSIFKDTLRVM